MLEDLRGERLKKLKRILEAKVDPYPSRAEKSAPIGEVRRRFATLRRSGKRLTVAGRILASRDQGGVMFWEIADQGGRIQAVLTRDHISDFAFLREVLDRGDFVAVTGTPIITKRGVESIGARKVQILSKSLRPLPTEWYGIADT